MFIPRTCRKILQALAAKRDEAPQFFSQNPLVLDCNKLVDSSATLDYAQLQSGIRELGFVPVGVRHLSPEAKELATQSGWTVLRDSAVRQTEINTTKNQLDEPAVCDAQHIKVISRPVRSGQQVYFAEGDIVVLSQTGAGSELLAGGSVHIYGNMVGRVLAGVNGDRSARIFCQGLNAELVSHSRLLSII